MNLDNNAARFIAVGMEFGGTVVAGVLAGYYLDMWLGTAPPSSSPCSGATSWPGRCRGG